MISNSVFDDVLWSYAADEFYTLMSYIYGPPGGQLLYNQCDVMPVQWGMCHPRCSIRNYAYL